MATNEQSPVPAKRIRIKYDEMSARYANQVVLNGTAEEILLDFSSGPVPDPVTGESLIPIHTRIAMSHGGARRLLAALQQSLKRIEASKTAGRAPSSTTSA